MVFETDGQPKINNDEIAGFPIQRIVARPAGELGFATLAGGRDLSGGRPDDIVSLVRI
jgi:hypothetical protein